MYSEKMVKMPKLSINQRDLEVKKRVSSILISLYEIIFHGFYCVMQGAFY